MIMSEQMTGQHKLLTVVHFIAAVISGHIDTEVWYNTDRCIVGAILFTFSKQTQTECPPYARGIQTHIDYTTGTYSIEGDSHQTVSDEICLVFV